MRRLDDTESAAFLDELCIIRNSTRTLAPGHLLKQKLSH